MRRFWDNIGEEENSEEDTRTIDEDQIISREEISEDDYRQLSK